ncbi:putative F-box protein At2g36090 [Bidens hawaiensis]|uniref:putative F-box protein At2g36090 n=1 Tax=Bidens hawaiensis TaxID=980011 RepID=UPI004049B15E
MSNSKTTGITSLPADIIESHVLTRLDGQTLAAVSCASAAVHSMSETNHRLWSDVCHSTWPSTSGEIVTGIISGFSGNGHREFYSQAFPLPSPDPTIIIPTSSPPRGDKLINLTSTRLISAVDIYHRNKLIFTKTEETETVSGWFQCSPFRIDLLDPKDMVPTEIPHPDQDATCTSLTNDMALSWILIDPNSKRVVNLSSHRPVSVQRHWLTGDVQMRFASVLADDNHPHSELVQGAVVVNCGRSEGGEMQVRELSMQIEDMDGKHLNGRDSLVILQRVMEGKRGNGVNKEKEAKNRYKKFEEMKRMRRERKLRVEETLDTLSVVFGLSVFAALFFIFC